jgi:hypothetical protein
MLFLTFGPIRRSAIQCSVFLTYCLSVFGHLVFGHLVFGHSMYSHSVLGLSVLGHSLFGHSTFSLSAFSRWIEIRILVVIARRTLISYDFSTAGMRTLFLSLQLSALVGFLMKYRFAKISQKWLQNDFRVLRKWGRVSQVLQFCETAEIIKETSFAKHENRENEEKLK